MKRFALLLADLVGLYGSLALTLAIRYPGEFNDQFALHLLPFSITFVLWLLIFYIHSLYDPALLRNTVPFFASLFRSTIIAGTITIICFYLIPTWKITPRANLFLFIVFFSAYEIVTRAFFNRIIEKRFHKRTVIVGLNQNSIELASFLKRNPQVGYELKALVDISPESLHKTDHDLEAFDIVQGINNIEQTILEKRAAVVILSPEAYQIQEIIDIFYKLIGQRVAFYNLASFYEKTTGRVPLGAINQIWFLENLTEARKRIYELGKRAFDVAAALILGILFLIIFPFILLAIKLDSSGPVFYRQRRIGRMGKTFEMIKLRTMHEHAERESGAVWAEHNDPRVTRVGRFFRKTRIDELPQAWNIFKGEMSFIGPRAERPEFHEKLVQEIPFYEERYLIKPGATGWAQLQKSYYSSVIETAEKLQYDLYYIKNRSLMLDVDILLKTANVVLRGGGR